VSVPKRFLVRISARKSLTGGMSDQRSRLRSASSMPNDLPISSSKIAWARRSVEGDTGSSVIVPLTWSLRSTG
jgi:hypothetical protein